MSFIGLKIPHECARLLGSIEVPGEKIPLDQMHVTVVYIGDNTPITTIAKAIAATYRVTSNRTPFTMKVNKIKSFPNNAGDGYPIIARVMCPELHEFHTCITEALDKSGIDYSKRYPEYKPHVTLAYSKEPIGTISLENPIEWAAHEATLWGGDSGDDRVSATFPFVVGPTKESHCRSTKLIKKANHSR